MASYFESTQFEWGMGGHRFQISSPQRVGRNELRPKDEPDHIKKLLIGGWRRKHQRSCRTRV